MLFLHNILKPDINIIIIINYIIKYFIWYNKNLLYITMCKNILIHLLFNLLYKKNKLNFFSFIGLLIKINK